MSKFVCNGAQLKCSFGTSPSVFSVIAPMRPTISNQSIGNITDAIPMANIKPFGMCKSMANPQVAAATAANYGKLQPMPCIPITASWMPGGKVKISCMPALIDNCKCMCTWGGQITISNPGNNAQNKTE